MKTIWIFQSGEPLQIDGNDLRPMRAIYLTNFLIKNNYKVVLWSSDFYHQKKHHRTDKFSSIKVNDLLTVQLIPSPGYKKNLSFKRLYDHFVLAKNLKKYLKRVNYEIPSHLILGFPPIETSFVFLKFVLEHRFSIFHIL